jgi:hypothetical protein
MSHIRSDIKLFFLGNRKYVQAPVQLEFAMRGILLERGLKELSQIYVRRFKQLQQTDGPLQIYSGRQVVPQSELRTTLVVTIEKKAYEYKLISAAGEIERLPQIDYRQRDYMEVSENEAMVQVPQVSNFWEALNEAVQLAKVFHVKKYNQEVKYRFVVGGFEEMRYVELGKNAKVEICCQIMQHISHENRIYNRTRIVVIGGSEPYSFIMPFIGKKLNDEY